jgi:hypothetical protein
MPPSTEELYVRQNFPGIHKLRYHPESLRCTKKCEYEPYCQKLIFTNRPLQYSYAADADGHVVFLCIPPAKKIHLPSDIAQLHNLRALYAPELPINALPASLFQIPSLFIYQFDRHDILFMLKIICAVFACYDNRSNEAIDNAVFRAIFSINLGDLLTNTPGIRPRLYALYQSEPQRRSLIERLRAVDPSKLSQELPLIFDGFAQLLKKYPYDIESMFYLIVIQEMMHYSRREMHYLPHLKQVLDLNYWDFFLGAFRPAYDAIRHLFRPQASKWDIIAEKWHQFSLSDGSKPSSGKTCGDFVKVFRIPPKLHSFLKTQAKSKNLTLTAYLLDLLGNIPDEYNTDEAPIRSWKNTQKIRLDLSKIIHHSGPDYPKWIWDAKKLRQFLHWHLEQHS